MCLPTSLWTLVAYVMYTSSASDLLPASAELSPQDPRQFIPPGGQEWTTLGQERGKHKNTFTRLGDINNEDRMTIIATEPKLGIGQRCWLLETDAGNVLWDCIAYLDDETISFIKGKGGLKAIVISHPHFYTTHLDWAKIFDCPVYVAKDDEEWLNREDVEGRRRLFDGPTREIVPSVTAVKVGGHFPGSLVLHWSKKLFIADTFVTVPVSMDAHDLLTTH
jgi:hypothetical protein